MNRGKDDKPISPFDFVPGMEEKIDPEREKRDAAKLHAAIHISHVPADISAEEFQTLRTTMVGRLEAQGLDGEQILREVLHEDGSD